MNTRNQDSIPRLLLVEDDMTSQQFFQVALQRLPARVDISQSCADARQHANDLRHDLWLIDANLPDGDGAALLRQLRQTYPDIPALAHTADSSVDTRTRLLQAGFHDVLVKPLGAQTLLGAVRGLLARNPGTSRLDSMQAAPDWDEATALDALNGQQAHLNALRGLFLSELPSTHDAVISACRQQDAGALRSQLHRLQASCGFVGASRLALAVRQLQQAPESPMARQQFSTAVEALLR